MHLVGIVALAFVLVTSDAFGSDDLSLARRILMFGVVAALLVVQASILADAARRLRGSTFVGVAAAAALAMVATLALMTVEMHLLKATPVVPYAPDPLPEFAFFLMPFVIPVSGLVLGLKWSMHETRESVATSTARTEPALNTPPAPDRPAEDWLQGPVTRVRAVDHYLELWTPHGTRLVRGRMRDALRRLPSATGIQPHRSWWVTAAEIDRIERHGRDHILLLGNGDRVPVARARLGAVKRFLDQVGHSQVRRQLSVQRTRSQAPILRGMGAVPD